mmetsp:Transcript_11425/g.47839  ORF Transcript_11425/g.47839 Transcript_11425/m.47839 type:complete len:820 (-) Transcript_11425:1419-3878(-)
MTWQAAHLRVFFLALSLGYVASGCTHVTTSPVTGSTIDTGFGTFELAPLTLGVDTPTIYTDFDTLVNYTSGIGWKIHRFRADGILKDGSCAEKDPPPTPPAAPAPPTPPSAFNPPPLPPYTPPLPRPPPNAPVAADDVEGLRALADVLREEISKKKEEAEAARILATEGRENANAKRADAEKKAAEAETRKASAQKSRDSFIETIIDTKTKRKAKILIDAAIAGAVVTKVATSLNAGDQSAACDGIFTRMQMDSFSGFCDAQASSKSSNGRRLLATTFEVVVILSPADVDQEIIGAAVGSLTASGLDISVTDEEPMNVLSSVPGLDHDALTSVKTEAAAAAAAKSDAEAAEMVARNAEADAAAAELAADQIEAEVVDLQDEIDELDSKATKAAEPPPPSSTSSVVPIIAALVAAGIIGPGTAFSVMAMCFKPLLRRKLLQFGCRRLADIVVPDLKSEVNLVSVKIKELEAFMSKQKLPRLLDITPDVGASEIKLNKRDVLGAGGYGAVFKALYNDTPVAVKALLGFDQNTAIPANIVKMMRREATIMCSLNHPNILRVLGVVPDRAWIVMELCEGGALGEWLQDPEESVDRSTQSRICSEIATGIAYLHMRDVSIVHGDLKAGNVLLTKEKSVRICDFGMSEAKNRSKTLTSAANVGSSTALTVAWSAPELFEDDPKSFATDVYALGVTLWEVYERRVPFGNMPEAAVVSQILAGKRPKFSSSDTPASVKRIIEACWSANHKGRPSAEKVAYVLTELWTHHPGRNQQEGVAADAMGESSGKEPYTCARDSSMVVAPTVSASDEIVVDLVGDEVCRKENT